MKEWLTEHSSNEGLSLLANSVAVHTNAVWDTTCLPCWREWTDDASSNEGRGMNEGGFEQGRDEGLKEQTKERRN